ncbi:MAG: prenyltransferase [Thermoplasmata archaeon]
MSKLSIWFEELRLPFMTASVPPAILGGFIAWEMTGQVDAFLLTLTTIAAFFMHAGTNVVNDYFDHVSGCDEINVRFVRPFGGGSRLIQKGLLSPKEVYYGALSFFAIAVLIGLFLAYLRGWPLLVIGLIGLICGYFYVDPHLNLAGRGIGEFLVGLNFGTLIVLGSFFVQTGAFALEPIVASIPLAMLIAAVLWINEFQDSEADGAVGKKHLVFRLGRRRATTVYFYLLVLAYASIFCGVIFGFLPFASMMAFITAPIAAKSVRVATRHYDDTLPLVPANAGTIMLHFVFGIVLVLTYVAEASNFGLLSIVSLILVLFLTVSFVSKKPQPPVAHPT